jgi:hypothetical protein
MEIKMNTITLEEIGQSLEGKLGNYGCVNSDSKMIFPNFRTDICAIVASFRDGGSSGYRFNPYTEEKQLYLFDKRDGVLLDFKIDSIYVADDEEDDASRNSIDIGNIVETNNSVIIQYTKFFAASQIDRYRNQEFEYRLNK